ncbi:hypothetical protein PIB30_017507 [Stylosanthes scabra]|uniref:Late embryogenesis abundant protein LEA-2 subgroup domain-containing protein n=1 Tax=Stylosanthes scabra TaxID=79078 RepID=A0ABU6R7W8_9FABA|nr:hypothetical protein [Stylosanthes scabra]
MEKTAHFSTKKHLHKNGLAPPPPPPPPPPCHGILKTTLVTLLCLAAIFVLWPGEPDVRLTQLSVRRVKATAVFTLSVTVKVRNGDVYWMDLKEVDVGMKYRGRKLGHVESGRWHVRGWGWCHVYGDLEFSGLPPVDAVHLIEDMKKGSALFHAVAEVSGQLGILGYRFPFVFKAVRACDVLVNTKNSSIVHQHCIRKD